jgi:hypothetical protein
MFQGDSMSSGETVSTHDDPLLGSPVRIPPHNRLGKTCCMRSGGHEAGGIHHVLGKDDDSSDGSRVVRSELKASNIVLNMLMPPRTCDSCSCSSGGRYTYRSSMVKLLSSNVLRPISRSKQSGRLSQTKES